jgi:signal transduction histidine kinase/CheY-like chemotaxis protein
VPNSNNPAPAMNLPFKQFSGWSIKSKFTFCSIATLILVVSFIWFYFSQQQQKYASQMMENKIKETGVMIATTIGASFKVLDFTAISQSVEGMQKNPDLFYLGIFGRQDNLISSYNPEKLNLNWLSILKNKDLFYVEEILFYSTPIKFEKNIYGTLLIGFSVQKIRAQINSYTNKGLIICLVIFFIGTLITITLSKILTKNLVRLKNNVQSFIPGEKFSRIDIATKDEVGELGFAFNKLIGEIDLVITNLKEQSQDLEIAKKEAEKANNAKSEFLSRMSHELRTPMNAILGFTQLLGMNTQSKMSDIEKKDLGMISSAGNHLLKLINEVLDLSRIESGNMELSIDTMDMAPVVDEVISFFKSLAGEKGISLEYQKIPDDCFFIEADPLRFKQVVLNLISNAIKYNEPNGSVIVSFEIKDNSVRRLGIRDTGHGIPDDKKDKLFKPFERFDVDAEHIEGTGIGLTISKQLIELMNGTIGFESKEGEGSYFYIDVPVSVKAPLPIQVEEKVDSIQPSLTNNKMKVLYIEDIPANVELVRRIFKHREEIKLLSASNALTGIELAQSETPDLILMDIHMPGMDGLTAFKKLQTIKKTQNIPVIALTADAMDVEVKKALDIGFKSYITKPIDVTKFLDAIGEVLA